MVFWLQQANHRLRQNVLAALREQSIELSAAQWDVLWILWQRDGLSQTALAEATHRDKAGMTRLIDGLAALGLAERRRPGSDRRRYAIFLTASGRRLHRRLLPIAQELAERALAGLGREERAALRSALKRVHANLKLSA